jgi:hypothetical protein
VKSFTEHELDTQVEQLLPQFGAQIGTEPVAEHIVGEVEQRDVLARPLRDDLARELDPDRTCADEEDTVRMHQLVVRRPIVVDRVCRLVRIALGGKRVRRSGRKDDVVGRNRLARRHRDPICADLYRPVTDHPPIGEEPVVRKEDPGQELRIDHGPERPDVVHERILGLDQHDLDLRIERLGDLDAPIPAPDDDDGRPLLQVLVHISLLS